MTGCSGRSAVLWYSADWESDWEERAGPPAKMKWNVPGCATVWRLFEKESRLHEVLGNLAAGELRKPLLLYRDLIVL